MDKPLAAKRLATHLKAEYGIDLGPAQALNTITALGMEPPGQQDFSALAEASSLQDREPMSRTCGLPYGIFIVGPSESGKSRKAAKIIRKETILGGRSIIFDYGRSYRSVVQCFGGTEIELLPDGAHTITRHGDTPLLVYEFELLEGEDWIGALPAMSDIMGSSMATLVVIDETRNVRNSCVVEFAAQQAGQGAAICAIGQNTDDIAPFLDIPTRHIWMPLGARH